MGNSELETLALSELRSIDASNLTDNEKIFRKIVLSHVIAANRREEHTDKRFESLEHELSKTNEKLSKVGDDIGAFKARIEALEYQRIVKLEERYEELDRRVLRIVAYAAGISTGISVAAGFLTFMALKI